MGKRLPATLLRLAVSAGLLALLFSSGGVDGKGVIAALSSARWDQLGLALLVYGGLGTLVRVARWQVLVQGLGHRVATGFLARIFLIGIAFNQVLPTGIGGDVARTLLLGRTGMGGARAASTVLADRALGMLALLAAGLVALAISRAPKGDSTAALALLFLAGGGVLAGALLRRYARVRDRLPRPPWGVQSRLWSALERFAATFAEYPRGALTIAMAWSLAFAGVMTATNVFLGRALGAEGVSVSQWALLVPLIALSLLVPSIGGLGVREWSYVGLLSAADPPVAAETATAISLAFHGLNLVLAAGGGLLLLAPGGRPSVEATDT